MNLHGAFILKGQAVQQEADLFFLTASLTMMALRYLKISVTTHPTIQRQIQEDMNPKHRFREDYYLQVLLMANVYSSMYTASWMNNPSERGHDNSGQRFQCLSGNKYPSRMIFVLSFFHTNSSQQTGQLSARMGGGTHYFFYYYYYY